MEKDALRSCIHLLALHYSNTLVNLLGLLTDVKTFTLRKPLAQLEAL